MKKLMLFWFRIQAAKAARTVLRDEFDREQIRGILKGYWAKYRARKAGIPAMPTRGGAIMLHLAAMSAAFYDELRERGKDSEAATQLYYAIAWIVYRKMGKLTWVVAGLFGRKRFRRLLKATQLFRAFPFNSPSYRWEEVPTASNIVGFDCVRCPVADYFGSHGMSDFCASTWCAFDFPLAEMWDARLERTGSIAGGASRCDFRWIVDERDETPASNGPSENISVSSQ